MRNTGKLSAGDMVIVGQGYKARLVRVSDISTIEVKGNDVTIRVNGCEPLMMRGSLSHCKDRLPPTFFAAGRYCLVNLVEVSKVNMAGRCFLLTMKDDALVPMSRIQSRALRQEFEL
jgi:DNA-binding LytR/AlgR family response regulator